MSASRTITAQPSFMPENGGVKITFRGDADKKIIGHSVYVIPKLVNGQLYWSCYSDVDISEFAPSNCKEYRQ